MKRASDLAILGGPPAFAEPLHVGRPNIGDRDRLFALFADMLDRRWLTNRGPYVEELERRIASMLGVRHCVAMCNATVGLEIAVRAAGLGGEVIVPSFTFVATAHALQWQGITPVFCDIDPRTHNIDPRRIEELITPRTTGIVGVHVWGRGCDTAAIDEIAARRGLTVLYDAAHAFACTHDGRPIGSFGTAEVLSFHATKFINAFEGGAVVTDDDALASRLRLMKNFGFADYDEVVSIGINGKMSEASAAMGLTSLESIDTFLDINRRSYAAYAHHFEGMPGIELLRYDETERGNYQYVVLEVDADAFGLSRDELHAVLQAERVLARRYFHPGCHRMEPYRSLYPDAGRRLPETERLTARVLSLPTGTAVDAAAIEEVCAIIHLARAQAAAIRERLARPPGAPAAAP